jgi:hypothetical protein
MATEFVSYNRHVDMVEIIIATPNGRRPRSTAERPLSPSFSQKNRIPHKVTTHSTQSKLRSLSIAPILKVRLDEERHQYQQ